jgi:hypothetical protein
MPKGSCLCGAVSFEVDGPLCPPHACRRTIGDAIADARVLRMSGMRLAAGDKTYVSHRAGCRGLYSRQRSR